VTLAAEPVELLAVELGLRPAPLKHRVGQILEAVPAIADGKPLVRTHRVVSDAQRSIGAERTRLDDQRDPPREADPALVDADRKVELNVVQSAAADQLEVGDIAGLGPAEAVAAGVDEALAVLARGPSAD